jgi:DNA-binding transcriptional ArsR family regulator
MTVSDIKSLRDEASNENIKLDYVAVKTAAMTLRAINHKLRQQIVRLLEEHKRMNVTDIYVKLRLEQSVASQHLAILRRANIVITQREGKFIHYSLNYKRIADIAQFVSELVNSDTNEQKSEFSQKQITSERKQAITAEEIWAEIKSKHDGLMKRLAQ